MTVSQDKGDVGLVTWTLASYGTRRNTRKFKRSIKSSFMRWSPRLTTQMDMRLSTQQGMKAGGCGSDQLSPVGYWPSFTQKKNCRSTALSRLLMRKEDSSMNTEPEPDFDYQAYMRSLPPRDGEGIEDPIRIHPGPEARQKRWKAAAYYNRGNTQGALNRHEEAIADYDKALQIDPQLAAAHYNRGNAQGALNRHEEAIADYDKALQIDPRHAAAYYNRGNAKGVLGRHEEAIADYDKALQIDPQLAAAYHNRGNAKGLLGRHEEAIADYDKALQIDPQLAAAYYNREAARTIRQRTSLAP